MYHRLDVVNKALMLYLRGLINGLLDLNRILVNFCAQFSGDLDFKMCLRDIVLKYQKHSLVALKQYLVFMDIHVLRGDCMLPNVRGVNDTKAILDEYCFIKGLCKIELRLS